MSLDLERGDGAAAPGGAPGGAPPRYAACGHRWHGLSLLDYALLSELSYFDPPHVTQF